MNDDFEKNLERSAQSLRVLFQHLPGGTKENPEEPQSG
jgi:hypothetical protein